MTAAVSIIIPAYNASRTIGEALESLRRQTLREIEIIVVDDGSTDATYDVVKAFSSKDPRIGVLHKDNGGAYDARRYALPHAHGRYVAFVDADDKVLPEMYAQLLAFADRHNLDVAQCDLMEAATNGAEDEVFLSREVVYQNWVYPVLIEGRDSAFVWNKLYRNRAPFWEWQPSHIMMFDDLMINLQVFKNVERLGLLHKGLYAYQINEGSSVRNFRRKNVDDLLEMDAFRRAHAMDYGLDSKDPVFDRWLARNAWNMWLVACSSRAESFSARCANAHYLVDQPCIAPFLKRELALGVPMGVAAFRALVALKRILARRFR